MTALVLNDEHLEVLYVLLNEEQDPKYFLPHFEQTCNELVNHGYMRLLSRITQNLKPQVEPLGLRAFLNHYGTREINKALRQHVLRSGISDMHWSLMERFMKGDPIRAVDIQNELFAYDLVNLGYAMNIFPTSGVTYYSKTYEGSVAYKNKFETACST